MLDQIDKALVARGDVAEALDVTRRVSEIEDPAFGWRGDLQWHEGGAEVAKISAKHGNLEEAWSTLCSFDDVLAIAPRRKATETLGEKLAQIALSETKRVKSLVFGIARFGRERGREEQLMSIKALVPLLAAIDPILPVHLWDSLVESEKWVGLRSGT